LIGFLDKKNVINQPLRHITQLVDKLKRIEQITYEKYRFKKFEKYIRKEKVAFMDTEIVDIKCENREKDVLYDE